MGACHVLNAATTKLQIVHEKNQSIQSSVLVSTSLHCSYSGDAVEDAKVSLLRWTTCMLITARSFRRYLNNRRAKTTSSNICRKHYGTTYATTAHAEHVERREHEPSCLAVHGFLSATHRWPYPSTGVWFQWRNTAKIRVQQRRANTLK